MRLFVNRLGTLTAVIGTVVYVVETESAPEICAAWGREAARGEFDRPKIEDVHARKAIEALIKCTKVRIGNRSELEGINSDFLRESIKT